MKRMVILSYCGICFKQGDGEEIKAEFTETIIRGGVSYELDWCKKHNGEFKTITDALDAFVVYGDKMSNRPPRPPRSARSAIVLENNPQPRSSDRYVCEMCGRTWKRKDYFARHVAKHSPDYVVPRFECNIEGCDGFSTSIQGLGMHRLLTHGIEGKDSANSRKRKEQRVLATVK